MPPDLMADFCAHREPCGSGKSGNSNADSCRPALDSVLKDEIVDSKTHPAAHKESYCKNNLDYSVKLRLSPNVPDAPDAAYESDYPNDNSNHNFIVFSC